MDPFLKGILLFLPTPLQELFTGVTTFIVTAGWLLFPRLAVKAVAPALLILNALTAVKTPFLHHYRRLPSAQASVNHTHRPAKVAHGFTRSQIEILITKMFATCMLGDAHAAIYKDKDF